MKRRQAMPLLCLLLLLFALPALAADKDVELPGNYPVFLKDSFYALSGDRDGSQHLLAYPLGDQAHRIVCQLPPQPAYIPFEEAYDDYPEETKQALQQMVSSIFSKDGQLMAINYYTGRLGTLSESGVQWTDQAVDVSPYFEDGRLTVYGTGFVQDGFFIKLRDGYDEDSGLDTKSFYQSDLSTGTTKHLQVAGLMDVAPYKEGTLLALMAAADQQGPVFKLAELSLKDGSTQPLPMALPRIKPHQNNSLGAIMYHEEQNSFFYATPGKLFESRNLAPFDIAALLPFGTMHAAGAVGIPLPGDQVAVFFGGTLAIRQAGLKVDLSNTLTIKANGFGMEEQALFKAISPGTTLFIEDENLSPAEAGQLIRNGDTETDLIALPAIPALTTFINKGYAAPLTNEALRQDLAGLYPAVQEAIMDQEGRFCAMPIQFYFRTAYIQRNEWQTYMKDSPYPTTWHQLFTSMIAFNQRFSSENPEAYFLFDITEDMLLRQVLYSFIRQYEVSAAPLSFLNPALRETLTLLRTAYQIQEDAGQGEQVFVGETSGDSRNAPSLVHLFGGGNPFNVPDSFGIVYDPLSPLVFEEGEASLQAASLRVMVINPNSKKKELAEQLLTLYTTPEVDHRSYYALRPGANTPYPNPNYEEAVKRTRDDLAHYTQALKEAQESGTAMSEDLRVYQFRIDLANQDLEEQDRLKYLIQQEGLDSFRQIAPKIRYFTTSKLLDSGPAQEQLDSLMNRYLAGNTDLSGFLKDLTDMARLVFMETQE